MDLPWENLTGKREYDLSVLYDTLFYLEAYHWMYGDRVPTKAGLCRALGIGKTTVYRWAELYDDFAALLEQVTLERERCLLNHGLSGAFTSTITKLALVEHGYADKSVVSFDGDVKDLSNDELDFLIKYGHLPSPTTSAG